jgi:hypothetical protein
MSIEKKYNPIGDRKTFKQGNTWLVFQNGDFVFPSEHGYDGPLMPGMVVMYQTKAVVGMKSGENFYGVDRFILRIDSLNGEGEIKGCVVEAFSYQQSAKDDSDVLSEEDEIEKIPTTGKLIGDALQVDYPLHSRGVMQCYTRVTNDPSFKRSAPYKFDKDGNLVQ